MNTILHNTVVANAPAEKKDPPKYYFVRETYMSDGIDVIFVWSSISEAVESGRFDYLYERDKKDYKRMRKCKTIEELISTVGYPFSIEDEPSKINWSYTVLG